MAARKIGRDARTGRIIKVAEAKARKAMATVETLGPRRRDGEVMRAIDALASAIGRAEAVLASVDRRLANLEAVAKDTRGGGRHNHKPDWMSA
jgi:hypothetical protein